VKPRVLLGLAPVTLYLLGLTLAPVLSTLWLSIAGEHGGITLDHFLRIANHYQFGDAGVNTFAITAVGLALEITLGLAAALALASTPRGRTPLQICLVIPLGVPTIVAAAVMRAVFGTVGYLNELLFRAHLVQTPVDWVGERGLAILTVAAADTLGR